MRRSSTLALATALLIPFACTDDTPTGPQDAELSAAFRADPSDPTPSSITLEKIGEFDHGGEPAAEITAYDEVSKRVFVVNAQLGTVDVLDLADPANPAKVGTIDVSGIGGSANGVATHKGLVAVAVEAHTKTDDGAVAFYRATTLELISTVRVGALPDAVTFTPSGREVIVANEGEPNSAYTVDPEGSISIIDVHNVNRPSVRTAGFGAFNGQADALRAAGVRIFGPGASVAQDLEPEFPAVSPDGRTAYVTLQENNALAIVDIRAAAVTAIVPLGYKDHSLPRNKLDASNSDGAVNIMNWPIFGMYQPDGIAAYSVGGMTYVVTANEGDAREYDPFEEEVAVEDLAEVGLLGPGLAALATDDRIGPLNVTSTLGLNPETGLYEELYAFGARSFSIWNAAGQLVFDSGDDFEQRTKALGLVRFNANNSGNSFDNRSDNKGPEPEGIVIGRLGRKTFAFIGLERVGGIMVYDISNPSSPTFETYINTRIGGSGDLGPEGLTFVEAKHSPNRHPLLIVGHEISGTTAVYQIDMH